MTSYYMVNGENKEGPFDLVSVIKRVRSGKITPGTLLLSDDSERPKAANEYKEIRVFFEELAASQAEAKQTATIDTLNIGTLLRDAWYSFGDHQSMTVVAVLSFLLIASIGYGLQMVTPLPVAFTVTLMLCGGFIHIFSAIMLLRHRGHSVDGDAARTLMSASGAQFIFTALFLSAFLFGIPVLLADLFSELAYLLLIPAFLIYGFFIFAPMLWVDNKYGGLRSFGVAAKWLLSQHLDTIGLIMVLLFINALAAGFFMFPLTISLPITMLALIDIYEQYVTPNV